MDVVAEYSHLHKLDRDKAVLSYAFGFLFSKLRDQKTTYTVGEVKEYVKKNYNKMTGISVNNLTTEVLRTIDKLKTFNN
jgi:hypothetical protein